MPAPPWTAADDETAAAAEATAREWLACINADDNLRIAALMSDAALTRFFAGALVADERARGGAGELGRDAGAARGGGARPTRVRERRRRLDDGRIVALVVINEPALRPRGQETLLLVFDPIGDRLLIDDIIQFSVAPAPARRRWPARRSRSHSCERFAGHVQRM